MKNQSFHRKQTSKVVQHTKLPAVSGFSLNPSMSARDLLHALGAIGFQATHVGQAAAIIRTMVQEGVHIYLTYTSNMVSSGLREIFAQLVREGLVHAIITTTGAIEEDVMKTQAPFRVGSFEEDDVMLKANKINRLGNLYIKDDQYCDFEDYHMKFLEHCYAQRHIWCPSEYIHALGLTIQDEHSILHWASKNTIPIYCPGIVDGAMGDHFFFFNEKHGKDPFIMDTAKDMTLFYKRLLDSPKTGGIILGGGIAKHHLIGGAILRNGLDYAVYISTGTQYDGSLTGAKPREAVSWNKLKADASNSVHVEADATLVFPLLALEMMAMKNTHR